MFKMQPHLPNNWNRKIENFVECARRCHLQLKKAATGNSIFTIKCHGVTPSALGTDRQHTARQIMVTRSFLLRRVGALVYCFAVLSGTSIAQSMQAFPSTSLPEFPRKPIRLIVPFAPGGGSDIVGRLIGHEVGTAWGQTVVVDNRDGAGGTIGMNAAAKAAPDGYTLLLASNGITYVSGLYEKLPFHPEKDFDAVIQLVTQPNLLVVHPSLPVKSLADLVALAKSQPGEISYGSGGVGSAPHLATELLQTTAGIKLLHVPYKGGGPAVAALMSNEVKVMIAGMATLLPHVVSGKVRALAVTSKTRAKAAPGQPTLAEAGLPGAEFDNWYGLLVPAGTPVGITRRINEAVNRALTQPRVQERLAQAGMEPLGGTKDEFADYLETETKKWGNVVRKANIKTN